MATVPAAEAADRVEKATVRRTSIGHPADRKRVVLAIADLLDRDPAFVETDLEGELLTRKWDPDEAEMVRFMVFDQKVLRKR